VVLDKLPLEERDKETYDFALKDLDLLKHNRTFAIGEKRDLLIEQIDIDAEFLRMNNIIDYSLLIGIHRKELNISQQQKTSSLKIENNIKITNKNISTINIKNTSNDIKLKNLYHKNITKIYGNNGDIELLDYNVTVNDIEENFTLKKDNTLEQSKHIFKDVKYFYLKLIIII
jgi:1-phosphatidylinositol-4-phosphate 5-kinase